MAPEIQFLGAAQTVTGSKFLLRAQGKEVLIDAGLFQGQRELRRRNWDSLPINPRKIDAVILTHAHIDHTGYLPRLVKQGFQGKVYCTPATNELLGIMLPDSGHLQEEEARYANKKGYSKHKPALPLYTEKEARNSLRRLQSFQYGREKEILPGITARMHPSGHILGSAFVEIQTEGKRIVFSGDVGSYDREVMDHPDPLPEDVDYLLVESTYGGRSQENRPVQDQIEEYIKPTLEEGGFVVIPAFAIGRTTVVMYHLCRLIREGRVPDVPVYVDSPMATDAVEIYLRYSSDHNLKVDLLRNPEACPIRLKKTFLIRKVEESRRLNEKEGPGIIISSSGMATGGRVIHHLKHKLPSKKNLVLLVGYQAMGTRGRRLLEGEDQVKIFGEMIPVRARVASIRGLSAHGDGDDMIRWMGTANRPPKKTFLVHGEEEALKAMSRRVREELRFPHHAPDYLERVKLP